MGWSGGSLVFDEIIDTLSAEMPSYEARKRIYSKLIVIFEDAADCDTLCECRGRDVAFDDVWLDIYGEDE